MDALRLVGGILAALVMCYLLYALLKPEALS
jgi:K+-transporting ATPase KdpF subunit